MTNLTPKSMLFLLLQWIVPANQILCLLEGHKICYMLGTNLQRIKIHETQSVYSPRTQKALQSISGWLPKDSGHNYHWKGVWKSFRLFMFPFFSIPRSLCLDFRLTEMISFTSSVSTEGSIFFTRMEWHEGLSCILLWPTSVPSPYYLCFWFGHVIMVSRTPRLGASSHPFPLFGEMPLVCKSTRGQQQQKRPASPMPHSVPHCPTQEPWAPRGYWVTSATCQNDNVWLYSLK